MRLFLFFSFLVIATVLLPLSVSAQHQIRIGDLTAIEESGVTPAELALLVQPGLLSTYPNSITSGIAPDVYTAGNSPFFVTSGNRPDILTRGNMPNLYTIGSLQEEGADVDVPMPHLNF